MLTGLVVLGTSVGSSASEQRQVVSRRLPDVARRTYTLLTGLPQHGTELGDPHAPVTIKFFGDLQCKESRQVMLGSLPILIRRWVRPGKVRLVYVSTETDTKAAGGWNEFREQQGAALAAGRQDKLWNFIDVFYREQGPEGAGYANDRFLHLIAVQAGLDIALWSKEREPIWHWESNLKADEALGQDSGVISTPSFLVGPTGGRLHVLRHFALEEPGVFEEAIRASLQQRGSKSTV